MHNNKQILRYFIGIFFVFSTFICSVAFASSVATVISLTDGVTVERNGVMQPLTLKDTLQVQDTIHTNATGKAQLIFKDDSAVSLGVNSIFTLADYNDDVRKVFKANLVVGFARFVTGTIVKSNPNAFSVKTPETHVGIRGTTFSVETFNGKTAVFTENSMKKDSVIVGNTIVEPGFMAEFGPNGAVITPPVRMTNEQRRHLVQKASSSRAPNLDSPEMEGLHQDIDFLNNTAIDAGQQLKNSLQESVVKGTGAGLGDDDDDDDDDD